MRSIALRKNFPEHHALIYDYAEVLLQDRQYKEAIKLLDEQVNRDGNDPKLYELQARAYAALDKPQEEHHMLAYYHILHGRPARHDRTIGTRQTIRE